MYMLVSKPQQCQSVGSARKACLAEPILPLNPELTIQMQAGEATTESSCTSHRAAERCLRPAPCSPVEAELMDHPVPRLLELLLQPHQPESVQRVH